MTQVDGEKNDCFKTGVRVEGKVMVLNRRKTGVSVF